MKIETIKLRSGAGNGDPWKGLCLMQMVDWFSGSEHVTDRPACASPCLTSFAIRLNDSAATQEGRDSLWPLVWQLLDSRDPPSELQRAEHMVREVAHRIVAPVFEMIGLTSEGRAIKNALSMSEILGAAQVAKAASLTASLAASLTAQAAQAADTASRGARAADAASLAALAADAASLAAETTSLAVLAADAASRAAQAARGAKAASLAAQAARGTKAEAWETSREILLEAIRLGKRGEEDPVHEPRAQQLLKILELTP